MTEAIRGTGQKNDQITRVIIRYLDMFYKYDPSLQPFKIDVLRPLPGILCFAKCARDLTEANNSTSIAQTLDYLRKWPFLHQHFQSFFQEVLFNQCHPALRSIFSATSSESENDTTEPFEASLKRWTLSDVDRAIAEWRKIHKKGKKENWNVSKTVKPGKKTDQKNTDSSQASAPATCFEQLDQRFAKLVQTYLKSKLDGSEQSAFWFQKSAINFLVALITEEEYFGFLDQVMPDVDQPSAYEIQTRLKHRRERQKQVCERDNSVEQSAFLIELEDRLSTRKVKIETNLKESIVFSFQMIYRLISGSSVHKTGEHTSKLIFEFDPNYKLIPPGHRLDFDVLHWYLKRKVRGYDLSRNYLFGRTIRVVENLIRICANQVQDLETNMAAVVTLPEEAIKTWGSWNPKKLFSADDLREVAHIHELLKQALKGSEPQ